MKTNRADMTKQYESDIEEIIAKRYDNSGDLWATPDKRIGKGSPFSTLGSMIMLIELGFTNSQLMKEPKDNRFLDALNILKSKMINGKIVVENPNRQLVNFSFCKKGESSDLATQRYNEIINNLE